MRLAMALVIRSFARQGARLLSTTPMQVVALHLAGMVLCLASAADGAAPAAPRNLTLVHPVLSRQVKITWTPGNPRDNLTDYLIVNRADGSDTKTVTRIDPEYTSYTLKDLKVDTAYIVYVKAAIGNLQSRGSAMLEFKTSKTRTEGLHRTFSTSGADLVIVFMVLALWFAALSLFFRTWRKKMSSITVSSSSSAGSPLRQRLRSRYRKPWMWSQKYRLGRAYPTT